MVRGPGFRRALGLFVTAGLLAGCTTPAPEDDGGPSRNLAVTPQSLAPDAGASLTPSSGATAGTGTPAAPGSSAPGSVPPGSAPPPATATSSAGGTKPPAAPFRVVGSRSDRSRDAGATTPGYADLTSITIEDDGTNARVTMAFAGTVPSRLPSNETMGVGVDFYRNALQNESEYQLFADGQPEGWFAYLHTPGGFVRYRGTFGIGGNRIVFTVPWSALGDRDRGDFSAFADWTRSATPANLAGEDFVPDVGHATYAR